VTSNFIVSNVPIVHAVFSTLKFHYLTSNLASNEVSNTASTQETPVTTPAPTKDSTAAPPQQNLTASTSTTNSTTIPPEQTLASTMVFAYNLHVIYSEHGSRLISLARDVLERLELLERREQQRVLNLLLISH
jgi:hypothetical protein